MYAPGKFKLPSKWIPRGRFGLPAGLEEIRPTPREAFSLKFWLTCSQVDVVVVLGKFDNAQPSTSITLVGSFLHGTPFPGEIPDPAEVQKILTNAKSPKPTPPLSYKWLSLGLAMERPTGTGNTLKPGWQGAKACSPYGYGASGNGNNVEMVMSGVGCTTSMETEKLIKLGLGRWRSQTMSWASILPQNVSDIWRKPETVVGYTVTDVSAEYQSPPANLFWTNDADKLKSSPADVVIAHRIKTIDTPVSSQYWYSPPKLISTKIQLDYLCNP